MKIVHVITGLNVGGAEVMLYKLLQHMDRNRFDNRVVSILAPGPVAPAIQSLDIAVNSLGMTRSSFPLRPLTELTRMLTVERPAIVQTWMYHADLLGLIAAHASRSPRVVWNIRSSNLVPMGFTSPTGWIVRACARVSRLPDAVIVNSEAGRIYHASLGYRPRRWAVIPNGFDLLGYAPSDDARASVRSEFGLDHGVLLVGMVANFHSLKGHLTFLAAAGAFQQWRPDVHYFLVGRGVDSANRSLTAAIERYHLEGRAHLLGLRTDVPRVMAALDVFTLSSTSEGFPNVVGEAMACGVPCVVTDVGDAARIVGDTGIVVPPSDSGAMSAAWRQILSMSMDSRRQLAQSARRRTAQNYSMPKVAEYYEELYLSVGDA